MKSSIWAFMAGGMTVLGVWMFTTNKQGFQKMVKDVSGTCEQMVGKMKNSTSGKKSEQIFN